VEIGQVTLGARPLALLLAFVSAIATGCSAPAEVATRPAAAAASRLLGAPAAGDGVQIRMTANVSPGQEAKYCQYIAPGQVFPASIDVGRFEHAFDGTSHHLFLYESRKQPGEVGSEAFACADASHLDKGTLMYSAQSNLGELRFPRGVARHVAADAVLLLEWHVVNATNAHSTSEAALNLWYATEPQLIPAGTLSYYHPFIHVPAQASASVTLRCAVPDEVTLLWATSHMHRHGVEHASRLVGDGAAPVPLFETDQWDDPPMRTFDEEIRAAPGELIELECRFQNDGAAPVIEGPSVDDEMCMFIAGYYPRMTIPFGEACSGADSGPVFHGERACRPSFECLVAAADEPAWERCWLDTSEASSKALLDLAFRCALEACPTECPDGGFRSDCAACLQVACGPQMSACNEQDE
jgi:hypothetical protein